MVEVHAYRNVRWGYGTRETGETVSRAVQDARQQMAALARSMLAGEIGLLEGCLRITGMSRQLPEAEASDPDVLTIRGVESEIDDMPVGVARALWDDAALAEKDRQRDEYLERARPFIQEACRAIAAK